MVGPFKKRDRTKLEWSTESEFAIERIKAELVSATLLVFPRRGPTIALMTYACDKAM